MKLVSGSLLVTLVSTTAWAGAPTAAPVPAPAVQAAPAAAAPSPERLDLARRYVSLGNSDDFMQGMRAVVMRSVSHVEDPEDKANAERLLERVFVLAGPKIQAHRPAILEAQAQAYAREFSASELQDMIAFAGTPTGQHYLARGAMVESDPAILDAEMAAWRDLGPIMEQVGSDMQKEACAKKAAARIAAGDKKAPCPLAKAAETAAG